MRFAMREFGTLAKSVSAKGLTVGACIESLQRRPGGLRALLECLTNASPMCFLTVGSRCRASKTYLVSPELSPRERALRHGNGNSSRFPVTNVGGLGSPQASPM